MQTAQEPMAMPSGRSHRTCDRCQCLRFSHLTTFWHDHPGSRCFDHAHNGASSNIGSHGATLQQQGRQSQASPQPSSGILLDQL
jgi:hypothetical protein